MVREASHLGEAGRRLRQPKASCDAWAARRLNAVRAMRRLIADHAHAGRRVRAVGRLAAYGHGGAGDVQCFNAAGAQPPPRDGPEPGEAATIALGWARKSSIPLGHELVCPT